ncbi:Aspartate aminotransferase (AspAT) (Transaminase A) [Durusdinium trenchii]|uniref:Aspartate aminotransferase (AspAT) (Transaminase A) n=1 Tax=Durusdinium trenchii TaxID=1381693 RepID=A0ABP0SSQ6_9DINO
MGDVRLERQLRYYFSDKNLWKDEWLVNQLGEDCTSFIAAEIIAGFNRVQQITSELDLVVASLKRIPELEVKQDFTGKVEVRRRHPLPPKPKLESEAGSVEAEAAEAEEELQVASTAAADAPMESGIKEEMESLAGFRKVPKTGVIYVMDEASKAGYCAQTAQQWANLGQGSPETTKAKHWPTNIRKRLSELVEKGKLSSELGPFSLQTLEVNEENLHYSSVNGDWALRRAVAKYYNEIYRKGKSSLYTAENVAIVGGGRLALTRLCCAMDNVNLGHFLPDYTAYAELLSQFKTINSIPIPLDPKNNFTITLQDAELRREIVGRGLSVLLLSNPCNPTGQLIEGEELKNWVRIARETQCSLVLDEIYSRYVYTQRMSPTDATWRMVSAAQFVDDVNQDPVIILDGLTKCWRMPGLRICWIVAPKTVIDAVGAAGSFLDGGPSLPTQRSCVPLLNPKDVIEQTVMLQVLFSHKRDFLLRRLQDMGITVEHPPQGTFYCWCDISKLPPPLNNCWGFFRELLREKVIVTPGVFFDVNPGSRRKFNSYDSFIRISYGPSFKEVQRGLEGMQRVIERGLVLKRQAHIHGKPFGKTGEPWADR